MLPIAATNRLFATGNDAVLEELAGLVVEYDGGDVQMPQNDGAPAIEVVALDAVRASDILPQIRGVLSVRQQQVLRMVAGPEDRTLILAGPAGDVAAVKEVLPVFDKLRAGERDIVILPLRGADAQASVERALTLAEIDSPGERCHRRINPSKPSSMRCRARFALKQPRSELTPSGRAR